MGEETAIKKIKMSRKGLIWLTLPCFNYHIPCSQNILDALSQMALQNHKMSLKLFRNTLNKAKKVNQRLLSTSQQRWHHDLSSKCASLYEENVQEMKLDSCNLQKPTLLLTNKSNFICRQVAPSIVPPTVVAANPIKLLISSRWVHRSTHHVCCRVQKRKRLLPWRIYFCIGEYIYSFCSNESTWWMFTDISYSKTQLPLGNILCFESVFALCTKSKQHKVATYIDISSNI